MTRKYQQRGYQEDDREREPQPEQNRAQDREHGPRRRYGPREPRAVNMPSFHEVSKCSRCGRQIDTPVGPNDICPGCDSALHTCAQCTWFDTASRFECGQPIPARVGSKQARNTCRFFEVRVTVERQTHSSVGPRSARQRFDDLFK